MHAALASHQYIEQIDETVRKAVLGNCGKIISFRAGGTTPNQDNTGIAEYYLTGYIDKTLTE